ncbi:MAG: hypothetical protein CMO13_01415 [Thaumarchaeota archaeon]|nr:hypothetical protein [Nitrososphaerota archaeon]
MQNILKNKNILVLGGSGFIGSNLINALTEFSSNLKGTYLNNKPRIINPDIEWIKADLTNPNVYKNLINNIDYVFISAAYTRGASVMVNSPMDLVTQNIVMNSYIFDQCYKHNVEKLLFISSSVVYPEKENISMVETQSMTGNPPNIYFPVGWMKRYSELLSKTYSENIKDGFKTVIIRPSNIYGPYDNFDPEESHVIPSLIRRVVNKEKPFEIWGDGKDQRDFIYIDDFIDGVINSFNTNFKYTELNLSANKNFSINDVLNTLFKIEDYYPKVKYDLSKPQTIKSRHISNEKASKLIAFNPKINLLNGLTKTIEWYKQNEL